jgi:uncharacterized membrane protein
MKTKAASPLHRLVFVALCAALIFVTTYFVKIPSPLQGYVHIGDAMLLFTVFILGAWYGWPAAAIGAGLADLIGGYFVFVPATVLDKALTAIVAGLIFWAIKGRSQKLGRVFLACLTAGIVGELVMTAGYFAYEFWVLDYGWAAAAEIPFNLVQGGVAVVVSTVLYVALSRTKQWQRAALFLYDRESKE